MKQAKGRGLVTIFEDRVEKITTSVDEVAAKYQAVHRIAKENGFVAPNVVSADRVGSKVILEKLPLNQSIGDVFVGYNLGQISQERAAGMFAGAGKALAALHRFLPTAHCTRWEPSLQFRRDLDRYAGAKVDVIGAHHGVLHGDYSFANLFVCEGERPCVAVIDPCPNEGSTHHVWELAPVQVDIGKFLACTEGQVGLRHQFDLKPKRIIELQRAFITGYNAVAIHMVEETISFTFAYATAAAQFRSQYGKVGAIRTRALYNSVWKYNYPLSTKLKKYGALSGVDSSRSARDNQK